MTFLKMLQALAESARGHHQRRAADAAGRSGSAAGV